MSNFLEYLTIFDSFLRYFIIIYKNLLNLRDKM